MISMLLPQLLHSVWREAKGGGITRLRKSSILARTEALDTAWHQEMSEIMQVREMAWNEPGVKAGVNQSVCSGMEVREITGTSNRYNRAENLKGSQ